MNESSNLMHSIFSGHIAESAKGVALHSLRTTVAAAVSLLAASLLGLPQSYWAPITTMVITQSSLGAALAVSRQRFIGTILGGVAGALVAACAAPPALSFCIAVFLLGLVCSLARVNRSAYRFGGVTLAIVVLVPKTGPAWTVAVHRCATVMVGIGVALLLSWVWPEVEAAQA